jgi:hypothetical protein
MGLLGLVVPAFALAGCISAAKDVRDYYREMAYNYSEARDKAKMDEMTLEGETKMLAKTGDFYRVRRKQRELDRIKSWESKCSKQEERFEKAAEWTEKRFHLDKPAPKAKPAPPPGAQAGPPAELAKELQLSPGSGL